MLDVDIFISLVDCTRIFVERFFHAFSSRQFSEYYEEILQNSANSTKWRQQEGDVEFLERITPSYPPVCGDVPRPGGSL